MKQKGKSWITAEGESTLAEYLPKHLIAFERAGQKIAGKAVELEAELSNAKTIFLRECREAYHNSPDQSAKTRFGFTTFDKEFRFEWDIIAENVRVYRATKKNPSVKDYELVNLDINRAQELVSAASQRPEMEAQQPDREEEFLDAPPKDEADEENKIGNPDRGPVQDYDKTKIPTGKMMDFFAKETTNEPK